MDTIPIPMDTNDDDADDISSDSDTWYYPDQDIDLTDDEISEVNWRYIFQETLTNLDDNKLADGARPLLLENECKIRIKKLGDIPYTFPLSNALCSRIICQHGAPLSLSNRYDFCGAKVLNSAWQIDSTVIDLPFTFSAAVRANTLEQLHLDAPHISTHFDLNLHRLILFGPCSQTKIYNFDNQLFVYHATVLVFLPSHYTGGQYRFIDDNDDDSNIHRHVFNQHQCDTSKPYILIIPSDCQHEIEPIEKGFKLLLVYHLVSKTNSIHELYSLLANSSNESMNIEHLFLTQRLRRLFNFWQNNYSKLPMKLLVPLQHSLDYSSYYSILFRDKYRITIELISKAIRSLSSSSFLIYSAILQRDDPFGNISDSRFVIHNFKLLNHTNAITLELNPEHERTFLPQEFLGELQPYIDIFELSSSDQQTLSNGQTVLRNVLKFHVLVLIPYQYQWDLLLDNHLLAYHHLSFMFSLPTNTLNHLCFNFLECILRDRISPVYLFDQILQYFIFLHQRFGLTTKLIQLVKMLFQNKQFKDEIFINKQVYSWLNRFVDTFQSWSLFSMEFLDLFRQVSSTLIPTKLNELSQFLLQFSNKILRALFINTLLRYIFKPRALPRHILFATLCSLLHLLVVDGSYSNDSLLVLAYHIIKRVRKIPAENEVIEKYFKIHLIPMIIHIYRDTNNSQSISPAFILIYEYCLNSLNYYCSSVLEPTSPLNIISRNEALLMCPCPSCASLRDFLLDSTTSTLICNLSTSLIPDHCLRHTLSKFPMLSIEYKHDPCTGREQTLVISKCGYEQEQKQLCFHLRRLLIQLHTI